MIALTPQIIEKNGKSEFVVLPYEQFLDLQEELADYEDLRLLREAKAQEGDAPTLTLAEVKQQLGIE